MRSHYLNSVLVLRKTLSSSAAFFPNPKRNAAKETLLGLGPGSVSRRLCRLPCGKALPYRKNPPLTVPRGPASRKTLIRCDGRPSLSALCCRQAAADRRRKTSSTSSRQSFCCGRDARLNDDSRSADFHLFTIHDLRFTAFLYYSRFTIYYLAASLPRASQSHASSGPLNINRSTHYAPAAALFIPAVSTYTRKIRIAIDCDHAVSSSLNNRKGVSLCQRRQDRLMPVMGGRTRPH